MKKGRNDVRSIKVYPENPHTQDNLKIFNMLKKKAGLSLKDISEKTGISNGLVADYINSCVKKDILKISASDKEELVRFNEDYDNVLGIGFNGDKCYLTLMNLEGCVISKETVNIRPFSEFRGKKKEIMDIAERISNETKLRNAEFCIAGISVPLGMTDMNPEGPGILADRIAHIMGTDVLISREATAAGYGERDFGERTKGKDVLYMYSDVGVGAVIKNDIIFEPGKKDDGENSAYLRPWEQFSIIEIAKNLVSKGVGTDIVNMAGGDVNNITLEIVFKAAEKKDELAEDLVKRSGLALGVRVAYLVSMFGVTTVILGGGVEKDEGNFARAVGESSNRFLAKTKTGKLDIVSGILGEEASSIGAVLLCRRELFMEV